ncbi:MAG: hypothetical protein A2144_05945 [Chloroflexi bacterium RBG_16_50_9]|nr:MAG: hypothetical protein A2144_05945 [Chloroflexi bacterium RBG_16_50_9]
MNVAIYAKDVDDEQMADLRAWVVSKGFTNIAEYRDVNPFRGRSRDKEFGRMCQDAREGKLKFIFINSFEQSGLIGSTSTNVLLTICTLGSYGVRLISREEPWTDLSAFELAIVYEAYCRHEDSETEMSTKERYTRARVKNNKPKDERDRGS